ncbi:MAG: VWA domain-containing protein [Pseudomonadota bacterium]
MITLAHPAWLFLLPLIALGFWFGARRSDGALPATHLVHPDLSALAEEAAQSKSTRRVQTVLAFLAACCLAAGLAQPQWLGPAVPEKPQGRDIMLLVDTSTTMSIDDFELNKQRVPRLDVLKSIARRFVAARDGDRFGLIAFGNHAATLAAPTFDQDLMLASLSRLQVGIAGEATAIGDALGLALKQVKTDDRLQPALILFSDGDNTAGEMKPAESVAAALALGVKIYTVEIGTDLFASAARPAAKSTDPSLKAIAETTGGKYYVAGTTQALEAIINDIGHLEPTVARPATRRQIVEWYWALLAAGAALLVLARGLALREQAA